MNFSRPALSFQYISRRLLRWICPLFLLMLLFANIVIVSKNGFSDGYSFLLTAQLLFYFIAFIGRLLIISGQRLAMLTIPFYFVFMNYCLVKGLFKFLKGNQSVLWEKSLRQARE